jgi:hypothetical protein
MSTQWPTTLLRPLCYIHNVEMRIKEVSIRFSAWRQPKAKQVLAYSCPEPDCTVHWDLGYFHVDHAGEVLDLGKRIRACKCPLDNAPMYIAQIDPKVLNLHVWRCPKCGKSFIGEGKFIG